MVKNLLANAGDTGLTPGSRRSPGEGNGNPLQYTYLGKPMDRGVWGHKKAGHGLATKQQYLTYYNVICLFNFYAEYIMRNAGLEEA